MATAKKPSGGTNRSTGPAPKRTAATALSRKFDKYVLGKSAYPEAAEKTSKAYKKAATYKGTKPPRKGTGGRR